MKMAMVTGHHGCIATFRARFFVGTGLPAIFSHLAQYHYHQPDGKKYK
jgi:hypothetical protein